MPASIAATPSVLSRKLTALVSTNTSASAAPYSAGCSSGSTAAMATAAAASSWTSSLMRQSNSRPRSFCQSSTKPTAATASVAPASHQRPSPPSQPSIAGTSATPPSGTATACCLRPGRGGSSGRKPRTRRFHQNATAMLAVATGAAQAASTTSGAVEVVGQHVGLDARRQFGEVALTALQARADVGGRDRVGFELQAMLQQAAALVGIEIEHAQRAVVGGDAGARERRDVREREQAVVVAPGRQQAQVVGADDEPQLASGLRGGEFGQRVDRERRTRPPQFAVV